MFLLTIEEFNYEFKNTTILKFEQRVKMVDLRIKNLL